jgi:hypothetical protein
VLSAGSELDVFCAGALSVAKAAKTHNVASRTRLNRVLFMKWLTSFAMLECLRVHEVTAKYVLPRGVSN